MENTVLSSTAFADVMTALEAQLSVASVVEIMAYIAGAGVGFVFVWWGARKAASALQAAFKRGKLKI